VLEIPPANEGSITGTVMDVWQSALEDVGPAGVDKGQGGKYLFLPPGYKDPVPAGYIPLASQTYAGYALLRSIPKSGSDPDVAKAVAYGKRIKLYPLSHAAIPPATTFIDAVDVVYDSTIPYDLRFFESLNRIVQAEPWLERDKAMIDQLKSIGIEKGKPFKPDPNTQDILNDAAREAHAWLVARYEAFFSSRYYEDGRWAMPGSRELMGEMATFYAKPDIYPVDDRGVTYSYGYFCPKHLGGGSSYLLRCSSASTDRKSRCSRKRGSCPTLRRSKSAADRTDGPVRRPCHGDSQRISNNRHAHRHARVHARLRQRLSDRRDGREALRRA
jgi:hypothetical protein